MGDTDSPDFNKARGYLIGFSMTVLLLWYFGADLSSFKLLGVDIKLHQNIKSVWMVLACINIYLWIRFFQRMPSCSFRFDLEMHELYERSLIALCKRIYIKQLRQCELEQFRNARGDVKIVMRKLTVSGGMTRLDSGQYKDSEEDSLSGIWNMSQAKRNEIRFALSSICMVGGAEVTSQGNTYVMIPHRFFGVVVTGYTFVKGALISPWFADNFIPLILGVLAISVAVHKWWQMNPEVQVVFKNWLDQFFILL